MQRRFSLLVFLFALVFFLACVPFGSFDTIVGDNIAQVGYWRSLFHRQFVGSIGASVMKPALIVVLGVAHDLSWNLFDSTVLIHVVFALAAAALVMVVASIARDVSGSWFAGCAAAVYLLVATPTPSIYTTGSSMIAFFPPLLGGVQAFARQRWLLGTLILCLAALVRLEAFAVLLWLSISEQLLKSRWRDFLVTASITAATLLFTVATYYAAQGSVARFGAGGPATGYVFGQALDVWGRIWSVLTFSLESVYQLALQCGFPYLALPAAYALARAPRVRSYASLLAIPLFWLVLVTIGQGQNQARYFQFVVPLIAGFGAAGVVIAFRDGEALTPRRSKGLAVLAVFGFVTSLLLAALPVALSTAMVVLPALLGWLMARASWSPNIAWVRGGFALLFAGVLLEAVIAGRFPEPPAVGTYTKDAEALLAKNQRLRGAAVLTEDDLIYSVIVKDAGFFRSAMALQDFNVRPEARRTEVLQRADFVVISKGKHGWNYLRYDPRKLGSSDPFRSAISRVLKRKRPIEIYGRRLVPVQNDRSFLILKVEPRA